MYRKLIAFWTAAIILATACSQDYPQRPAPTPRQASWQDLEYYMFCHFGPNTFTNMEWGLGNEDPSVFNPTDLDCRQWARIAKAAGMKGIIITAKHHDGFCLWPSAQSTHTVAQSSWRDGKGDVLKELSEACKAEGILFGVYVSPWDRNHPAYGTPEYNKVYAQTLREVHTGYGKIFEQWFDGANGEGPNGKKQIYDWELFHNVVRELSPDCVMFSDVGPDIRWIGNEKGYVGETNWNTMNTEGFTPGAGAPPREVLNQGEIDGAVWVPGEVDVSIRPGWFYSPDTDDKVKSTEELMGIWFSSVGRGSNLLLNVPPDRRGKIHPADSAALMNFKAARDKAFANDLAKEAKIKTRRKGVQQMTIDLKWGKEIQAGIIELREDLANGQYASSFRAESISADGSSVLLCEGTTIGHKRLLAIDPASTSHIRVTVSTLGPTSIEASVYPPAK